HSLFVKKIVATSSTFPVALSSCSTRNACGLPESTAFFAERAWRIVRSSSRPIFRGSRDGCLPCKGLAINRRERLAVAHFVHGKQSRKQSLRDGPPLEAPLFETRHRDSRHLFNSPPHDLPLQCIEPPHLPIGQLNERNPLRHIDHVGQGIRTEARK